MEIVVAKLASGILVPVDSDSIEYLQKKKIGVGFRVSIKSYRNYKFHKKFFCLLNYAFDIWNPAHVIHGGYVGKKEQEEFRNNITILCGHHREVTDIFGRFHLRAKSISFAALDQEEFEKLYSKAIDVILKHILTNYTKDDLESTIDTLLRFAGH